MFLYQLEPKFKQNIKISNTQGGHLGFLDFEWDPLVCERGSG